MNLLTESLFKTLFDQNTPRILLKGDAPNFTILQDNDLHKKITNTVGKDLIGKSLWEIFDPEQSGGGGEVLSEGLMEAIDTKRRVNLPSFRYDIPAADGQSTEVKWWQAEIIPINDLNDSVSSLLINSNDVTATILVNQDLQEAKRREEGLAEKLALSSNELSGANEMLQAKVGELNRYKKELERLNNELEELVLLRTEELLKFKFLADHAEDALILMRQDGTFAYLNKKARKNWGYDEDEFVHLRVPDVDPIYQEEKFVEVFALSQQQTIPVFETLHKSKDGTIYPVEVNMRGITLGGEPHLLAVARDITQRKRTEQALEHQYYITKLITDNASLGLFMMNDSQQCTFMNPAAEKITGFSFSEVSKLNIPLHDIIHHTRPDGSVYPLEECPIDRALPTRNQEKGEDVFVRKDGAFYPVAFTASPIVWEGKAVGTVIEVRDTTEEKKAAALMQELMNRKDEFLNIASHELKTPVASLKAYTQLLKRSGGQSTGSGSMQFLERMESQILRLENLIKDLLDVNKINAGKMIYNFASFDFNSMLKESIENVQETCLSHKIILQTQSSVVLTGNRFRLEQVLNNLLTNAIKYSPGKDKIDVSCDLADNRLKLSVRDFGIGIAPEEIEHLFGRYYRSSNLNYQYSGVGLGLYISNEIVKRHGGEMGVVSTLNEGSTFWFSLPLAPALS
jgi:PAS domain S-box-containing protein